MPRTRLPFSIHSRICPRCGILYKTFKKYTQSCPDCYKLRGFKAWGWRKLGKASKSKAN